MAASAPPPAFPASPASSHHQNHQGYASLYLASQSPRRRELLTQIGAHYELLLPDSDENAEALEATRFGESARDYVTRVCLAKAQAATERRLRRALPPAPVLSADTTVTIDGLILGKPTDAKEAVEMLQRLSGRVHQVMTAVAVAPAEPLQALAFLTGQGADLSYLPHALSVSDVRFATLSRATIDHYVDSGEPFGKAGAYGIQGRAAVFVEDLHGSYSGVMGLPLFETARLLKASGLRF